MNYFEHMLSIELTHAQDVLDKMQLDAMREQFAAARDKATAYVPVHDCQEPSPDRDEYDYDEESRLFNRAEAGAINLDRGR